MPLFSILLAFHQCIVHGFGVGVFFARVYGQAVYVIWMSGVHGCVIRALFALNGHVCNLYLFILIAFYQCILQLHGFGVGVSVLVCVDRLFTWLRCVAFTAVVTRGVCVSFSFPCAHKYASFFFIFLAFHPCILHGFGVGVAVLECVDRLFTWFRCVAFMAVVTCGVCEFCARMRVFLCDQYAFFFCFIAVVTTHYYVQSFYCMCMNAGQICLIFLLRFGLAVGVLFLVCLCLFY